MRKNGLKNEEVQKLIFSGHETKYFINDVPSSKKEYEQKIASVIDEELFKTITNPLYFPMNI